MRQVVVILAFGVAACSTGSALRQPGDLELIGAFDSGRARVEFHAGPIEVVVLDPGLEAKTRATLERAGKRSR
jgi:hypothetical protein